MGSGAGSEAVPSAGPGPGSGAGSGLRASGHPEEPHSAASPPGILAASGARSLPRWAPLAVVAALLALYLTTADGHFFSDGVHLVSMVEGSPKPYYNLAYVPLGWLLHRAVGVPLGLDAAESLRLFSALSVALAGGLLTGALRRRGVGIATASAWLVAFALAPSVWFFATTVEVHGPQVLGLTVATLLALSAADHPRRAALLRVGVAVAVALASHLTSALLVPALVLAGRGRDSEDQRGLSLRPGPLLAIAGAGLVLAPLLLWIGGGAHMLQIFADLFLKRFEEGRLYSFAEQLEFTWSEAVLALGLLWAALVLAPLAGWGRARSEVRAESSAPEVRRLTLVLLTGLVPFLLVFPQGGVRERGGYFLSFAPLLVLLGAEATRKRPRLALVVGFAALALGVGNWNARRSAPDRLVATEWAARTAELVGPDAFVYTTTLARWHALAYVREDRLASDVVRAMQLSPRKLRTEQAALELAKCLPHFEAGVFLDRELFGADLATPANDWVAPFVEALLATPVTLVPVDSEGVPGALLLVRVVLRPR